LGPSFSEPKMKVPFGTIFGAGIETDESCDDFRNRVRTWLIEIVRGARPFKFPVLDPVFDVLTYEMAPVVIAPKRPVCMPFCFGAPRVTHVVSSEDISVFELTLVRPLVVSDATESSELPRRKLRVVRQNKN
jgi:hypothetical protein